MKKVLRLLLTKRFNRSGFSLIELSVIISVAAAAAIGFLSWTQPVNITDSQKAIETYKKMQDIMNAIEVFRVNNGRLPCPADKFRREDNTRSSTANTLDYSNDYGLENIEIKDTIGQNNTTSNPTLGVDCYETVGALPALSLNLDRKYMLDAWGNNFTYHVSDKLCGADSGTSTLTPDVSRQTGCTPFDYNSKTGDLQIQTYSMNGNNTINNASYVIVSHGANGKGSFGPNGAKSPAGTGYELENSNEDKSYIKQDIGTTFDDLLVYTTKVQTDRFADRKNEKLITPEECDLNSQELKQVTKAEAGTMDGQLNSYVSGGVNQGQTVMLSMLRTIQSACIKYYGYQAQPSIGWQGAQCPGNSNPAVNGTTYYPYKDHCTCAGALWDGNCKMDWDALHYLRSNLVLWLDANDIDGDGIYTDNPASGSPVSSWVSKDPSTNVFSATQATATNQPLYIANLNNGLGAVRFDGVNDYMKLNGQPVTNKDARTIFIVGKTSAASGGGPLMCLQDNLSGNGGRYIINTDTLNIGINNGSITWGGKTAYSSTNKPHIMIFNNASNSNITATNAWMDGVSLTSTASTSMNISTNDGNLLLGSTWDQGSVLKGDLSEILIYNVVLTEKERLEIEKYLAFKWGITL